MRCAWRQGLSRATARERMALLDGEAKAKEVAFGEAYQERCDAAGSILVDSTDLAIRSVHIEWCRYKGDLLAIYHIHHRSAGRVRTIRWRLTVPKTGPVPFSGLRKRGLKDKE